MTTPLDVLIEDRRRLPSAFRWRDRCLTIALWGLWWLPVDTIRHLFVSETARWTAFVADLAQMMGVAAVAVTAMVAWGLYDRRWARSVAGREDLASLPSRDVVRRPRRSGPRAPIALGQQACRGAGRRVTSAGSLLALCSARPEWPPPCTRGWHGDPTRSGPAVEGGPRPGG
jgi:hypothetical protein